MKNVKLKFNDIWVDVEDGWLCVGDSENQILLKPEFFNKLLEAINYTRCCERLKVKKTLNFRDWTEQNNIGLDENGQWFINGKGDVDIDTLIDMHVRDICPSKEVYDNLDQCG